MSNMPLLCKVVILQDLRAHEPLFGQWRIEDFLGAGANGCVYKIIRHDLGQRFEAALKVIPLTVATESADNEATLNETIGHDAREILNHYTLSGHSNVVSWHNHQVITRKEDGGVGVTVYLLLMMDFLPNSLATEMKKGLMPLDRMLEILIGCCRGLEHIHSRNIIHRDLKPENIFIDANGTPKIGDFGIARQVSETSQAQTVAGTPLYMAPEVYRDPFGKGYGSRADIYALGLIGFELLEGRPPFAEGARSRREMVERRFKGAAPTFATPLPEDLKNAIATAMAFEPEKRYASAALLRFSLEKVRARLKMRSLLPDVKLLMQSRRTLLTTTLADTRPTPRSGPKAGLDLTEAAGLESSDQTLDLSPPLRVPQHRLDPDAPDTTVYMAPTPRPVVRLSQRQAPPPAPQPEPEREPDPTPAPEQEPEIQYSQHEPDFQPPQSSAFDRRLVRLFACDQAVDFTFYSKEVCERIVEQSRRQIESRGYVAVEFENRNSPRVHEERICGKIVAIRLVEDQLMAEMEVLEDYRWELESLLDAESYLITPKCLGFDYQRGEVKHLRPEYLQLLSFNMTRKTP